MPEFTITHEITVDAVDENIVIRASNDLRDRTALVLTMMGGVKSFEVKKTVITRDSDGQVIKG